MSLSVPSSGSIDFLTLATVFGLSGPPYDLARLKRDGTFVPNISTNNAISTTNNNLNLLAFRGSTVEQTITLANSTDVNLYTLFTASYSLPTSRKFVKFIIPSGVTIGATSTANYALSIGAFPTGTTVVVEISGSVQGAGGAGGTSGVGANGGPAINADVAIATTILVKTGGSVYGGGGGGGKAGAGGAGGRGGDGNYVSTDVETRYNYTTDHWREFSSQKAGSAIAKVWDSYSVSDTPTITYSRGSLQITESGYYELYGNYTVRRYQIIKTTSTTISTTGGNGGGGGTGGNGGRGAGYNQTSTNGSGGSSGSGGAAGGTNAGTGGTGGSGGTGGNGGALGTAGTSGGSGNTGATGANGNVSNGVAGVGGSSGSGGGSAGTSIYKPGRTNVTVTIESGTVLPAV